MPNAAVAAAQGNDSRLAQSVRSDPSKREPPPSRPDKRTARLYAPTAMRLSTLVLFLLVGLVLYAGWRNREDTYLMPEAGHGYALGIIGGTLMLLLLLYPLRKKARFMRSWGSTAHWFRVHMLLGVVGPVCVLFHANFSLGSFNSNVALLCMLLVAVSGIVGRYFYTKIHYGLYGQRITLEKLYQSSAIIKEKLASSVIAAPQVVQSIESYEARVLVNPQGILDGAFRVLTLGIRTRWTYFVLRRRSERLLKSAARNHSWSEAHLRIRCQAVQRYLSAHLAAVRKVAELGFYERLFALWHLLHLPLFLMMILTALVHVIAVHMY